MKLKVVIMGASGDGLVVAQTIRDIERYDKSMQVIGFLDDGLEAESIIYGLPVLGGLASWSDLNENTLFIPALHKLKKMFLRKKLLEQLGVPEDRWATVIHPTAKIADDVAVGYGSFVASNVTIQPGATVCCFASIRAGANLGHNAIIDSYCYIGPNATLCGGAQIEEGVHIGPNAVVVDGIVVGHYAIVGAGSVATKNITAFDVCFGVPARKVSSTIGDMKRFSLL